MFKVFYNGQFMGTFDTLSEAETYSATLIDWVDLPITLCIKDAAEVIDYQCTLINNVPEYYNG